MTLKTFALFPAFWMQCTCSNSNWINSFVYPVTVTTVYSVIQLLASLFHKVCYLASEKSFYAYFKHHKLCNTKRRLKEIKKKEQKKEKTQRRMNCRVLDQK